jgi:hypothetical protein
MKNLIISALDDAFNTVQNGAPKNRFATYSINVFDVNPIELPSFMSENNVPDDAYFAGVDNGYDGYSGFVLEWQRLVPATDEEKLKYIKERFANTAYNKVYKALIPNGYKRVGVYSSQLKKDSEIYEMYISKDFDGLVSYYSKRFVKDLDN